MAEIVTRPGFTPGLKGKLIVDCFAGGGGMSTAIETALGRSPSVAINHNEKALSLHRANHRATRHFVSDIWEVDPKTVTRGQQVGLAHFSPDCTHHSQASGGQPRSSKIRGLSWVACMWGGRVQPDVITLENVRQIRNWGPLVAKRDKETGRVLKLVPNGKRRGGGTKYRKVVAAPGERVPVHLQYLIPDPRHTGRTWKRFLAHLESLGYQVKHTLLMASAFGAGTSRDRLFLVARRDGVPIEFPKPTHGDPTKGLLPLRPAADFIDFSLPCHSIFLSKEEGRALGVQRPLKDKSLRRIAGGVMRHVIESAEPFIMPITHASDGSSRTRGVSAAAPTITGATRGELALVAPVLVQASYGDGKPGGVQRWGNGAADIRRPAGTFTASSVSHAVAQATLAPAGGPAVLASERVAAFLAQHNNHRGVVPNTGHDLRKPISTITGTGSHQGLTTTSLVRAPVPPATLTAEQEAGALRVAVFLTAYYSDGGGQSASLKEPAPAVMTKDRLALVTVTLAGEEWIIVDIGIRMLTPSELFLLQGFPADYVIDRGHDGKRFSKAVQVKLCGNSVSPPPAVALLRSLFPTEEAVRQAA